MAMMNESADRRMVEGQRQRAVLITIDYEGYGYIEDGNRFRGRAVVIHAPSNFRFEDRDTQSVQIDREISRDVLTHTRMPAEALKNNEFSNMEIQLLRAARELAPHGPEVTLIPTYEYRNMEKHIAALCNDLGIQKRENIHLARRSMLVRNDALRWKALAKKLRLQRDAAPVARLRRWAKKTIKRLRHTGR